MSAEPVTEAVAGGASVKAVGQGGRDRGEGRQEVYDLPHALLMLRGAAPVLWRVREGCVGSS